MRVTRAIVSLKMVKNKFPLTIKNNTFFLKNELPMWKNHSKVNFWFIWAI